ncbi:MAG: type II secretion system protein J [Prochloraceae cyanobacterium]
MKRIKKSNAGFTLVELMVTTVLTGFLVSAAGFGVVQMMQVDRKSSNLTEGRVELNQAKDYIAEEIRASTKIDYKDKVNLEEYDLPSDGQPVIGLNNGKIIYYQRPQQSGSIWQGPNVLWRWDGEKASVMIDQLDSVTAQACNQAQPSLCAEVSLKRDKVEITTSAVIRVTSTLDSEDDNDDDLLEEED